MKIKLTVYSSDHWSLSKVISLPETVLHVGSKINLDMGPEGIDVVCSIHEEKPLKEGSDLASWEAWIIFVGPGVRVVSGGKNHVDNDDLSAELKKCGWE